MLLQSVITLAALAASVIAEDQAVRFYEAVNFGGTQIALIDANDQCRPIATSNFLSVQFTDPTGKSKVKTGVCKVYTNGDCSGLELRAYTVDTKSTDAHGVNSIICYKTTPAVQ